MAAQKASTVSTLEAIFNPPGMYGDMQATILSCLDNNDLNALQRDLSSNERVYDHATHRANCYRGSCRTGIANEPEATKTIS